MKRCCFINVEFIKYIIVHKFTITLQYYIPIVVFSFTLYIPMYVIIRVNTDSTKKLYQKNIIVYIIHSLEIEITFRRITELCVVLPFLYLDRKDYMDFFEIKTMQGSQSNSPKLNQST